MKIVFFMYFSIIGNLLLAQHSNVLISSANSPNEPSIYISPFNTDTIIAAANIHNYYISYDAGLNWTSHTLSSTYGVWGDPCIVADSSGHFYFFHLSNTGGTGWIDRIVCQKTTDAGQTWNNGSFVGLNGLKDQDKEWATIDFTNNNIYLTWTEFDVYNSSSSSCKSRILFSKSTDEGATWSLPLKINEIDGDCVDEDETTEGATSAIGQNGEIFVTWAGPDGLVFNKSLDEGDTWLTNDVFIDGMPYGWDYNVPGIGRTNGMPITKCDLSGKENHGTIYVNWSDQRNGADNTDIWLSKSIDAGTTWTSAIRVNQDNSEKHQFFTWMDIDQTTGYLYFVYYDRRAYSDSNTDVYLAYSTDGGETFKEEKISESPFIPNSGIFFGDYNNISVDKGVIRPIWTRLHAGSLSVHTAIVDTSLLDYSLTPMDTFLVYDTINTSDTIILNDTLYITDTIFLDGDTIVKYDTIYLEIYDQIAFKIDFVNYPNPSSEAVYFSFKLHEKTNVSLKIYDYLGREILAVLDEKKLNYGKHIYSVNSERKDLSPGIYFYSLKLNGVKFKQKSFIVN